MRDILFFLFIAVLFGCSNKKEELLDARMELVNGSLEEKISIASKENDALYDKLSIDDKTRLDTIKKLSEELITYLDHVKNDLINYSGGYNEVGELVNTKDFSISYEFILNSKYGNQFKETLNAFASLIIEMGIFKAPKIVLDGGDDPYWSQIPNLKHKSALELIFANSNVTSSLATISLLQSRILEYEGKVYQQFLLDELDSLRAR